MITDYNRNGANGLGSGEDDLLGLGAGLKAMGGNMNKLSSSYASARNKFGGSAEGAADLANLTMEKTSQDYSGGLGIGQAIKMSAGSFSGVKPGAPSKSNSSNFFKDLIDLILGIIKMPLRFRYIFMSTIKSTEMLALGLGGMFQSFALGIEDIGLLFFELLKLIAKYGLCILSFIVTFAPCCVIHVITALCFLIYYWLIYVPISGIDKMLGTKSMKTVDSALSGIWWPKPISMLCYSCFGMPVKLTDFFEDVQSLQDVSDKMSHDFDVKIPRYLRPAMPAAKEAKRNLDKAFE